MRGDACHILLLGAYVAVVAAGESYCALAEIWASNLTSARPSV